MHRNKVSVIIPTYNCAKYLPQAIESILNQTYKDYEIIIVDDGSTDNTKEIISVYQSKIKYIYQDNAGVSKARNTGIQNSTGMYIAFLDADDRWLPFKLELQIKCFEKLPNVDLIFSDFSAIKQNRIIYKSYFYKAFNIFKEFKINLDNIFQNKFQICKNGQNLKVFWGNIFKTLFLGNFILPSTVILKKKALSNVGYFNEKYRVAEETEFFLRFAKYHNMAFIEYPLAQYRLPEVTNLSGKKNTAILIKNALNIQFEILKKNPSFAKENKQLVQEAIAKTYYRLSYFYLSELQLNQARLNALKSIEYNSKQIKPLFVLMLSFFPQKVLQTLAAFKHKYFRTNEF